MAEIARRSAAALGCACAAMVWGAAIPAGADDIAPDTFGLNDPTTVMVGVGAWEVDRDKARAPEIDLVARGFGNFWVIKPQVDVAVAGDGDIVAFAGPAIDLHVTPNLVATASTAVGVWAGGGFDLGARVEFHSGLDVAWRFDDASRVGVGFYHTSNADISDRNPGSESVLLEYWLPLVALAK